MDTQLDTEFEWRDEYNIGVEQIDCEHKRLFHIINKLFRLKEEKKNHQWVCQEGIKFFRGHAMKHFEDEEVYMESIGYEGLAQHREIHRGFRENTLRLLEQELERSEYSQDSVEHFLGVCAGWLIGHTLTEDRSITGKQLRKWDNILSGKERDALKKVITQLVFDMFQLESQMISDAYAGEKFGSGVYYRMVFGSPQHEEKMEIMMVFEEKLLINTVGKILGFQTNKLEAMLVHAARYTVRQFVTRVLESFPDMTDYAIIEENLLSYSQFREIFEHETLQASLLFNTGGAGYFAFCMIAPHLLENGVGTPLDNENAMDEVEKYLSRREEKAASLEAHPRPKILIVDDSETVRLAIKNLLEKDYRIETASSGVAAIRAAALNKPELILLDYEMPVCDGRQTLEMLRSEPEFSDLPVIFLTGRRDRESMIQVMPLKPAGYLLKNSRPEFIKEKIDLFFAAQKL